MPRIALDAMGGDRAPVETIAGAIGAAERGVDVVVVGDEAVVRAELGDAADLVSVVHAPTIIGMGDDPARAVRDKQDASVVVCSKLVAAGEVEGFVSAGSTGAAMASAAIVIGRLDGVSRPTIASVIPGIESPTVVLDSGANPEVKPEHLVQFARMGAALAEVSFGRTPARVGLLSNGEERGKGRALERAAFDMLEDAPLPFVGNVEGRDVATDRVDVIVTDGFTGNVLLKTIEGSASLFSALVAGASAGMSEAARAELSHALAPVLETIDYEATGGAYLLGVEGVVVIAHGSSSRKAVANALVMASEAAAGGLVGHVAEVLAG